VRPSYWTVSSTFWRIRTCQSGDSCCLGSPVCNRGHGDPQGPWIPVGIGNHTGLALVVAVGIKEGVNEIAVLGKAPNLAARLSSQAAAGEILVSEAAAASAGLKAENIEHRQ